MLGRCERESHSAQYTEGTSIIHGHSPSGLISVADEVVGRGSREGRASPESVHSWLRLRGRFGFRSSPAASPGSRWRSAVESIAKTACRLARLRQITF